MTTHSGLPTSPHFELQQLADGVYAAISAPTGAARSNSGIVDLGDRTLVLDTTMSPNACRDLVKAAEELTGNPVSVVINSHYHPDHNFGNMVVPAQATIISTTRTRELSVERLPQRLEGHKAYSFEAVEETQRELEAAATDEEREQRAAELWAWQLMTDGLDKLELRYADQTFERKIELHGAKRSVQVITFGGGHTESDAVLWLPEAKIVFTRDLVFNGRHPWAGDGNPSEWVNILDKIKELKPQ